MKIIVTQEKLAKALNNVSRVAAGTKATLAVLNNVLIRADNKKVSLTTTNLDMAMVDYLPVAESEDGVVTVPAKLLAEFVSNLPRGAQIEIKSDANNKVSIKADKYSSIINGVDAEEFPVIPEMDKEKAVIFKMGVDEFKSHMAQVTVAASNDTTRPALTGVFFNTEDGALYAAATDGYRLAERKIINKVKSEVAAIVPSFAISEVIRSISEDAEEVEILFDEVQVKFLIGEIEITSNLIDGSYPEYRKLIPKQAELVMTVKKDELVRVTKLAALFAREAGGSIVMDASAEKNTLGISSVANEFGENVSEIEVEVEKSEKTTVNSRFMIDCLNALEEDEVVIGMSGGVTPVIFKNEKNEDYIHIVMPLKS